MRHGSRGFLGVLLVVAVAACGGGSTGSPSPSPVPSSTPMPTASTSEIVSPSPSGSPAPSPGASSPQGGHSIAGHVLDTHGKHVGGIELTATATDGAAAIGYTGSDGSFTMTPAGPGPYVLFVRDALGRYAQGYYDGSGIALDPSASRPVDAGSASVVITVPVGRTASGRVLTADGAAVRGATVFLSACTPPQANCRPVTAVAGKDAAFLFEGLLPGRYGVGVNDAWGTPIPGGYKDLVVEGAEITGWNLTAPAGWQATGASIQGTVRTATRAPLAGVRVTVTRADGGLANQTTSAPDGTYLVGLPPGAYKVLFESPVNRYYGSNGLVVQPADATSITLGADQFAAIDAAIQLPAAGIWKSIPADLSTVHLGLVTTVDVVGADATAAEDAIPTGAPSDKLLAAFGRTRADVLEMASARDHPVVAGASPLVTIYATRYRDMTAAALLDGYAKAFPDWSPACGTTRGTAGAKPVLVATCPGAAADAPVMYVYAHDDVLFELVAPDVPTAEAIVVGLP